MKAAIQEIKVSCLGNPCLEGWPPIKTPAIKACVALPWLAVFYARCHTLLLGEISIVHVTPLGEDN